ncbi:MAG: STAS domain-containing protein [Acidobacteriota bacterium]
MSSTRLPEILKSHEEALLKEWISSQKAASTRKLSAADEKILSTQSGEFLGYLREAAQSGDLTDIQGQRWAGVRDFLADLAASRAKAGYSPTETAMFVFSLKEPLFNKIRVQIADPAALMAEVWSTTVALDKLGLFTIETFQKTREEVISRQQKELLELSTPVVRLWDNVLALPLIGTLDSNRTQVVMQNLLEAIVSTRSDIAIIDITGVPTVDTLVAQHLLKTVAAARLMGADCIISGIRPQIAQTIIHLGVDLSDVTTKATMADAFQLALKRVGATITTAAKTR